MWKMSRIAGMFALLVARNLKLNKYSYAVLKPPYLYKRNPFWTSTPDIVDYIHDTLLRNNAVKAPIQRSIPKSVSWLPQINKLFYIL
jgi:hypothetical protein